MKGTEEFTTLKGYEDWIRGLADGTHIATTSNMTKCYSGFGSIDYGTLTAYSKLLSNLTLYGTLLAWD